MNKRWICKVCRKHLYFFLCTKTIETSQLVLMFVATERLHNNYTSSGNVAVFTEEGFKEVCRAVMMERTDSQTMFAYLNRPNNDLHRKTRESTCFSLPFSRYRRIIYNLCFIGTDRFAVRNEAFKEATSSSANNRERIRLLSASTRKLLKYLSSKETAQLPRKAYRETLQIVIVFMLIAVRLRVKLSTDCTFQCFCERLVR